MFHFILLGIIQGLTEFLPVSSSGHLYLIGSFLKTKAACLPFFVWLHLATLLVVLLFFRRQILLVLKDKKLSLNIVLITVITVCVALTVQKFFESYFGRQYFIASGFFVTAALLFFVRKIQGFKTMDKCTITDSIILGVIQGLAVIPGISRSGATIAVLLKMGFKPQEAFKLSFVASVPVIIAAFIWESRYLIDMDINTGGYAGGFVAAFLAGFLALKILSKIIKTGVIFVFGYYCVFMGVLSILI